jgi:tetratricopeptide (TPR) repeat protein
MVYNAVSQHDEALLDQMDREYRALGEIEKNWDTHIKYSRACMRIAQHRFEEAIEMFKELLEINGWHQAHCLIYLIDIYEHLEDIEAAATWIHAYFDNWRKEHGGSIANCGSLFHYLKILADAGEFESVIKYGLERIKYNYRSEQYLHFLVAQSYLNLKDLNNALKYYNYIFKRKQPYPEAYSNIGVYYSMELNDHATATKYIIKAAKACGIDPNFKIFLYNNIFHNFAVMMKLQVAFPEKTSRYRRDLFEALCDPLALSDLVVLFSLDRESTNEYRAWLTAQSTA